MPPKHPDDYPEPDVLTRAKAIFQADNHSDLDWEMSFRPGDRFDAALALSASSDGVATWHRRANSSQPRKKGQAERTLTAKTGVN
jgi:hypothetical protein